MSLSLIKMNRQPLALVIRLLLARMMNMNRVRYGQAKGSAAAIHRICCPIAQSHVANVVGTAALTYVRYMTCKV